jgi:hypothetical protein
MGFGVVGSRKSRSRIRDGDQAGVVLSSRLTGEYARYNVWQDLKVWLNSDETT